MSNHNENDQIADSLESGAGVGLDVASDVVKRQLSNKMSQKANEGKDNGSRSNGSDNFRDDEEKDSSNNSKSEARSPETNNKSLNNETNSNNPSLGSKINAGSNENARTAAGGAETGVGAATGGAETGAGAAAGVETGAGAGAAAAAGAAAETGAGAAAGAGTGAAAGSAAGPVGAAAGAAAGGLASVLKRFIKYFIFIICLIMLFFGAIIDQLVPNLITKPVSQSILTAKGFFGKAVELFHNLLDFFSGTSLDERRTINSLEEATQYSVDVIDEILESAYDDAYADIEQMCIDKGYDYDATVDSFTAQGGIFNRADYAFIIATYSTTTDFMNVTIKDFKNALRKKLKITYTLEEEATQQEVWDSVPIHRFDPEEITICVDEIEHEGDEDEDSWTEHITDTITIYHDSGEIDRRSDGTEVVISDLEGEYVPNYVEETVSVVDGDDDEHSETVLILGDPSEKLVKPIKRIVTYGKITMNPFKTEDVYTMFGVDPNAKYVEGYDLTYRQMIQMRVDMITFILNNILASSYVEYATNGLNEEAIESYMSSLPDNLSGNRKQVIKTALSLVGMVPYYYGGKPHKTGWNDNWWSQAPPDHKGRTADGLDCSGYVQWVFATAGFNNGSLDNSLLSTSSISNLQYINKAELQPGDIGLKYQGDSKHTGIYMGNNTWIHCSSSGTVIVSPGYQGFNLYKRYRPSDMEGSNLYTEDIVKYSTATNYAYSGDSWYLISQCVYQECSKTVEGTVAVAECIRNRVLSPEFPNDPLSVVKQKGQFESFGAGHYKQRTPTSDQIELVKQVLGGTKKVLNNQQVLYFVSTAYHRSHYLIGNSWLVKAGYVPFGDYGDNMYYIHR